MQIFSNSMHMPLFLISIIILLNWYEYLFARNVYNENGKPFTIVSEYWCSLLHLKNDHATEPRKSFKNPYEFKIIYVP